MRSRVADASAYDALPVQALVSDQPLCRAGRVACDVPPSGSGVVSASGDVLVSVVAERGTLVAMLRSGSDSAVIIGRDGAGPGEYRAAGTFGFDESKGIVVFDVFSRRLVRFDSAAVFTTAENLTLPPAPLPALALVRGTMHSLAANDASARGDTLPIFLYSMAGNQPARQMHPLALRLPVTGLGQFTAMPTMFSAQPQFAFREDGSVLFSNGIDLTLRLFDSTGTLRLESGFRREGREVTAPEVESERERQLRALPPLMRAQAAARLQAAAPQHAAVTALLAMSDGTVWVREAPDAERDSVDWVRFDASLAPMSRTRTGADDRVIGVFAGRVLLARAGADEESTGYWWMRLR